MVQLTHMWIGLGGSTLTPHESKKLSSSIFQLLKSFWSTNSSFFEGQEEFPLIQIQSFCLYYIFTSKYRQTPPPEWFELFGIEDNYIVPSHSFESIIPNFENDQNVKRLSFRRLDYQYFVSPRLGMVSPWSSKSTDIAKIVLGKSETVDSIERGQIYQICVYYPSSFKKESVLSTQKLLDIIGHLLYDRLVNIISLRLPEMSTFISCAYPTTVDTNRLGHCLNIRETSLLMGLGISELDINHLEKSFSSNGLNRPPTDAELFMFAQINSEHCRHNIFQSKWENLETSYLLPSLFDHIKSTFKKNPGPVISAYSDNGAVLKGSRIVLPRKESTNRQYLFPFYDSDHTVEEYCRVIKVETHNHPTAVCPFPGAATGSGGDIRDEGAVGRGSCPKAALVGFSISDLHLPDFPIAKIWEESSLNRLEHPPQFATPLDIIIHGPLGAASYNNEFGRPLITGYFRSLTVSKTSVLKNDSRQYYGYHKPIMVSGGLGHVRRDGSLKFSALSSASARHMPEYPYTIAILGGPGYRIGLGGGSASSQSLGTLDVALDFASVQRDNAELERRCQEVINECTDMGSILNPIISIHDVGAGGLSNAIPELVHDVNTGAWIDLRKINVGDPTLSPLEIWCNESQERYVIIVNNSPTSMELLERICARERCPIAAVGHCQINSADMGLDGPWLKVWDDQYQEFVVSVPMDLLFPPTRRALIRKLPKLSAAEDSPNHVDCQMVPSLALPNRTLHDLIPILLSMPTIASKSFLVTIADRSITGLVARDSMVGPWQIPIADVGVIRSTYPTIPNSGNKNYHVDGSSIGEAIAMGERPLIALVDPISSARMAIGEALTNLLAADIDDLESSVAISANWMATAGPDDEYLYAAVDSICNDLLDELKICIPVGKDSLSMKTSWKKRSEDEGLPSLFVVQSPMTLVVSAFGLVKNVGKTLTPQFQRLISEESLIILISLSPQNKQRLGGSCLAQLNQRLLSSKEEAPNFENPNVFVQFTRALAKAKMELDLILAYHDRSDGGLLTTLIEMAICGRIGIDINLDLPAVVNPIEFLLNEELGIVLQVKKACLRQLLDIFESHGFPMEQTHIVGYVRLFTDPNASLITIKHLSKILFEDSWMQCYDNWSRSSNIIQSLRESPITAMEEYKNIVKEASMSEIGFQEHLKFDYPSNRVKMSVNMSHLYSLSIKPRVAILREEGVNGHMEMAYAFTLAGFESVDVTMTDLLSGHLLSLSSFHGLIAPGGFSYGDCLGAGRGWSHSILMHSSVRKIFEEYFHRPDTFTLGVCNGCQMLSYFTSRANEREMIPGSQNWPLWKRNKSEAFESRVVQVKIPDNSRSIFWNGTFQMTGSSLPVPVAHGEGCATPRQSDDILTQSEYFSLLSKQGQVALYYVNPCDLNSQALAYPYNPSGSISGIAGVSSLDGRVTLLMPHPERVILKTSESWRSSPVAQTSESDYSPWVAMFINARLWLKNNFSI